MNTPKSACFHINTFKCVNCMTTRELVENSFNNTAKYWTAASDKILMPNDRIDEILFDLCDISYAEFIDQKAANYFADRKDIERKDARQAIERLLNEAEDKKWVTAFNAIRQGKTTDIEANEYENGECINPGYLSISLNELKNIEHYGRKDDYITLSDHEQIVSELQAQLNKLKEQE